MHSFKLFSLLLVIGFISCQKDGDLREIPSLTDEDLAMTLEASLSAAQGGMTLDLEDAAEMAADMDLSCGASNQMSTTQTGSQGNYSISASWSWNVLCEGPVPNQINFLVSGKSTADANNLSLQSNNEGSLTASNLVAGTDYLFNGSLNRVATTQIKTQQTNRTILSNITIVFDEIKVKKLVYEVTGGSATIQVKATLDGGDSVDYTGKIVFHGSRSATITLNNGQTYTINL
ncbi:MAG: hypothetical protein KDC80_05160 [Saprospiraceae bacterium]|nr:hypothetical protein [Saprospiraceae bacterium]